MERILTVEDRYVTAFMPDSPETLPAICLLTGSEEEERQVAQLLDGAQVSLLCIRCDDWNRELSPWPAPAVFSGEADFSGGADEFLEELTEVILPETLEALRLKPCRMGIAGYSLAGLFALYAAGTQDCFHGAACVSGSLWYPGWTAFAARTGMKTPAAPVYLSLGDSEDQTRNPLMSCVKTATEETADVLRKQGSPVQLTWNAGNHFAQMPRRMADGILWLGEALR